MGREIVKNSLHGLKNCSIKWKHKCYSNEFVGDIFFVAIKNLFERFGHGELDGKSIMVW